MTTPNPLSGTPYRLILVGVDFSDAHQQVLEYTRAHFPGAALHLLHVMDARAVSVPDLSTGGLTPVAPGPDITNAMSEADHRRMNEIAREGEESRVIVGDPAQGLIEDARRIGADLIVVGAHNRGVIERFFVGSVAETVVRRSHIPVLVVKQA